MPKNPESNSFNSHDSAIEHRDKVKESATENEKHIAEMHAADYEATLYKLMGNNRDKEGLVNHELMGAINDLMLALNWQARGAPEHPNVDADKPIDEEKVKKLIEFFRKVNYDLRDI